MTKDTLSETAALRALLSETSDTHMLAEMLGFVADRLMALDVDQLCGAGAHERSDDRVNRRNGYRTRARETRAGKVDVKIPKLRKGSLRNPTHPVSDSDNIRSRATIIRSPRDVAAERGLVMSPWTGSVKRFGPGAAGAVRGAARAL